MAPLSLAEHSVGVDVSAFACVELEAFKRKSRRLHPVGWLLVERLR